MSIPAIVWLTIGVTTVVLASIFLVAFVRQMFGLGRAIARFAEEAGAAGPSGSPERTR